MNEQVEFLDLDDVLQLARLLFGDPPPVRDVGLLGSAIARPQTTQPGSGCRCDNGVRSLLGWPMARRCATCWSPSSNATSLPVALASSIGYRAAPDAGAHAEDAHPPSDQQGAAADRNDQARIVPLAR